MAKIDVVYQPLPTVHADLLIKAFSEPWVELAVLSSAFVVESGLVLLLNDLKARKEKVTLIAGIRNGVTSIQGLACAFGAGTRVVVVDTGTRSRLFHPKVYAFWGKDRARVIVGSSNLTHQGLQNNIEAVTTVDLDLKIPDDRRALEATVHPLRDLEKKHPKNVFCVTTMAGLDTLFEEGRIEDETAPKPVEATSAKAGAAPKATIPAIGLPTTFPKRTSAIKSGPKAKNVAGGSQATPASQPNGSLLWAKRKLAARDIQMPGQLSNPTGVLSLTQSHFRVGGQPISQITYFRQNVFKRLAWKKDPSDPGKEIAATKFELRIGGISHGNSALRISHKKAWEAGQGNYTTAIHWGTFKASVQDANLLGRELRLYAPTAKGNPFIIEID